MQEGKDLGEEMLVRFLLGGFVVSSFAALSDMLKPKTFAGLFGAAPSIALATLRITLARSGSSYAALEARSMIAGSVAFIVYARCASWLMMKQGLPALWATSSLIALWLVVVFGLWFAFLK